MNATVAYAVLELARELVGDGWTTGAYVRSSSGWAVPIDSRSVRRVCAAGALDRAGVALDVPLEERDLVRTYLVELIPLDEVHVISRPYADGGALLLERWNDTPGRTRDDVLALYDRALEHLRELAPMTRRFLYT